MVNSGQVQVLGSYPLWSPAGIPCPQSLVTCHHPHPSTNPAPPIVPLPPPLSPPAPPGHSKDKLFASPAHRRPGYLVTGAWLPAASSACYMPTWRPACLIWAPPGGVGLHPGELEPPQSTGRCWLGAPYRPWASRGVRRPGPATAWRQDLLVHISLSAIILKTVLLFTSQIKFSERAMMIRSDLCYIKYIMCRERLDCALPGSPSGLSLL